MRVNNHGQRKTLKFNDLRFSNTVFPTCFILIDIMGLYALRQIKLTALNQNQQKLYEV